MEEEFVFVLLNVGEEEEALVLCEQLLRQVCCRVCCRVCCSLCCSVISRVL